LRQVGLAQEEPQLLLILALRHAAIILIGALNLAKTELQMLVGVTTTAILWQAILVLAGRQKDPTAALKHAETESTKGLSSVTMGIQLEVMAALQIA